MGNTVQLLPPKTAAMYAERAMRMDNCIKHEGYYEFTYSSMVVVLMSLTPPSGHMLKDARRAREIRNALNQPGGR